MAKKTIALKGKTQRKIKGKGQKSGKNNILTITVVVVAVVIAFIVWRKFFVTGVDPAAVKQYPVFGVDVSKHSGEIDWQKLLVQNVKFAYVKATEGENYVDPLFKKNFKGAKEAGILTGAYHFFRFNKDGKKQAAHFAKNAKIKKGDLLPVIDVETWGNTFSTKPDKAVVKEIGRFLKELERLTGARPMIYTNKEAYNRFIKDNYDIYPLWFCDLEEEPSIDAPGWDLWQYSHHGEIEGAPNDIDFNVFRRGTMELRSLFVVR